MVNAKERQVLEILAKAYVPDEWGAYSFAPLAKMTELEVKEVRRACRSLARKGLAQYERSLWSEDGPAGAGYRATEEGAALINPCGMCGRRATYEYTRDDRGLSDWDKGFAREKAQKVFECGDHYKQTPYQAPLTNPTPHTEEKEV